MCDVCLSVLDVSCEGHDGRQISQVHQRLAEDHPALLGIGRARPLHTHVTHQDGHIIQTRTRSRSLPLTRVRCVDPSMTYIVSGLSGVSVCVSYVCVQLLVHAVHCCLSPRSAPDPNHHRRPLSTHNSQALSERHGMMGIRSGENRAVHPLLCACVAYHGSERLGRLEPEAGTCPRDQHHLAADCSHRHGDTGR